MQIEYVEEWFDIPTWIGIFKLSNYGRVKRLYKNGHERILNGQQDKDGYIHVSLQHKGRKEGWQVNRLMATVFQRPILETEHAHHKNHFPWCNCVQNIQIKDSSEHLREHKTGKPCSQQKKQQISKALKGRKKPEGFAEKLRGRTLSQQTKQKISLAKRGKVAWNKDKHVSEQTRQRMKQAWVKRRENK